VATAVFLTGAAETEAPVTYRYGPQRDDQPQTLSILEQTGETTGTTDRAGWIRRQHERTGRWIERGTIAT